MLIVNGAKKILIVSAGEMIGLPFFAKEYKKELGFCQNRIRALPVKLILRFMTI